MTHHPPPPYYDDLQLSLDEAWGLLARGALDRHSPLRTLAVATVADDGAPSVRHVVSRKVDRSAWNVRFHTDQRAAKFRELSRDPRIALVGYHPGAKTQIRLSGHATLLHGNDAARRVWQNVAVSSRACYRVATAPGAPIADPHAVTTIDGDGEAHFTIVDVAVDALEWLYLAAQGHRRARYSRAADGAITSEWLVP